MLSYITEINWKYLKSIYINKHNLYKMHTITKWKLNIYIYINSKSKYDE